jgi:hypothetical protein
MMALMAMANVRGVAGARRVFLSAGNPGLFLEPIRPEIVAWNTFFPLLMMNSATSFSPAESS